MLKVLFDHCTPRQLKREFGRDIRITEAQAEKLAKTRNGKLEKKAHELGYHALVTVDTDFGKPAYFPEYRMPVVLLRAIPSARPSALAVLIPEVKEALLSGLEPGLYIWDNYKGTPLFARSLAENKRKRKKTAKAARATASRTRRPMP